MSGTKVDYASLSGGLDLVSGAMSVRPGRMLGGVNFEQVFGKIGYRRIDGYERFDGHPEPSKARYYILGFKEGTAPIPTGVILDGFSGNGEIVKVVLESGDWNAGDAAGFLVLTLVTGEFNNLDPLKVAGSILAIAEGDIMDGRASDPMYKAYLTDARGFLRSKIQAVPGSGKILGVAVFNGDVYALRNAVDGESAALWRSSLAGWLNVGENFLPGGRLDSVVANFTGLPVDKVLYCCDGVNPPWAVTNINGGSAIVYLPLIYGTQASSSSTHTLSTGTKTFISIEPMRSWKPGDRLMVKREDSTDRMMGMVINYTLGTNSLQIQIDLVKGSGDASSWLISSEDNIDKPYLVQSHKNHLFLAYPSGQLQSSNVGDPMTWTDSASSFGLGDTITGLSSLRGSLMGVFCLGKIQLMEGSSSLDWSLSDNSTTSGARLGTVRDMSGNVLFLDERGLTCLQASQKFGGFEPSIFSREVKPMLDALSKSVVSSVFCKSKFQYRMYFAGGQVLTATVLSPDADIQPGDVAFTNQTYLHNPSCNASGSMPNGEEGLFFGTDDGFVMREGVGTSFDGESIESYLRLHFNLLKSPENKKRYRKISIEMDAQSMVEIKFQQQFDFDDGYYMPSINRSINGLGGGGQWDVSDWDNFLWSVPFRSVAEANVDGVGKGMGLTMWHQSDFDQSFNIQGIILQYSVLGMSR